MQERPETIIKDVDSLTLNILDEFAEKNPDVLAMALVSAAAKVTSVKISSLPIEEQYRSTLLSSRLKELYQIMLVTSALEYVKLNCK